MVFLFLLFWFTFATASNNDPNSTLFNEWFHTLSHANTRVEVRKVEGMGRGVFTTARPVKKGDRIMSVPLTHVLTGDVNSPRLRADPLMRTALAGVRDEGIVVCILLIYERLRGAESDLAPWVNIIPRTFHSTHMWTVEERNELQSPERERRALDNGRGLLDDYNHVRQKVWPKIMAAKKMTHELTRKLWFWAAGAIDTRAWNMVGHKYLVPGADFFNHDLDDEDTHFDFSTHNPNVRSQKFLTYHKVTGTEVHVMSDRGCKANDQLYESYGDNNNEIFMDYHGFVPEWNPYHCVKMAGGGGRCLYFGEKLKEGTQHVTEARRMLQAFPTTVNEDAEALKGNNNGHIAAAIRYRMSVKRVLAKALERHEEL